MDATTAEPAAPALPTPVAVYGLDGTGRPHCSYFAGGEAEGATRAAQAMGMHVLALAGPACDGLADQMPAGRLFSSGKAFVPFCKQPLYDRLATLGGVPLAPAAAERKSRPAKASKGEAGVGASSAGRPAKAAKPVPQPPAEAASVALSWNDVGAGSLVLATTGEAAAGWFESVVVEAKADQLFVLRWRDWAAEPVFLRRIDQLALLPVGTPLVAEA